MKSFHMPLGILRENFSCEKISRKMSNESSIRFARMRKKLGLTQEAVADALNVTTRTIINWEGGHHEPRLTVRQTKALCLMLKITDIRDLPDNIFEEEQSAGDAYNIPGALPPVGGDLT
jgi:DNA-binding XRE family transcriptional regulator